MSNNKKDGDYRPIGINCFVPSMMYAGDVQLDAPYQALLGAPSTLDADGILNDVSATTTVQTYDASDFETTYVHGLGSTYGRNLTATGTAGSNHVVTVTGTDYLGQVMKENLTLAATAVIAGKKAFYTVTGISAAVGASGDTFDLGWGDVLGLPYKANRFIADYEDEVLVNRIGNGGPVMIQADIDAVRFAAGTSIFLQSPIKGDVLELNAIVSDATTGTGVITVELDTVAVSGLSVSVTGTSAVGVAFTDSVSAGSTTAVAKYGDIELTGDGTPSAGSVFAYVVVVPNHALVGSNATQTATTADSRGTFTPDSACDGSIVYTVVYEPDRDNLHGLIQFSA